jgi:peptidoglycan/LPS O-acetylase OafA/YrhL
MNISKNFSAALDCMRWVAALEVVAFHLRRLMFSFDPNTTPAWKMFFLLTSYGHEAVIVFFVLSGFLVGGSVMDDLRLDRFSWRVYLAKRIARLYPVVLLGLLAGLGVDTLGVHYFNHYQIGDHHAGVYSILPEEMGSINTVVASNLGFPVVLANLLMLQTIVRPPLGSNGPLWSLCNEFWYYMLFPLAASLVFRRRLGFASRLVCGVLFAAIGCMVGREVFIYFLIWLLGVGAALLARPVPKGKLSRILTVLSPLGVVAALAFCKYDDIIYGGGFGPDFILAVSISMAIYSFQASEAVIVGPPRAHRFLADFSYSLYIFHFPLLLLAMAILSDRTRFHFVAEPSGSGLAVFFALVLIAMFVAYCVSQITERRTAIVRDFLLRVTASRAHCEKKATTPLQPEIVGEGIEHRIAPRNVPLGATALRSSIKA